MKITRENYEAYFIDYLEGTLDERYVDDFIEFLQQNPDLKNELTLFEPVLLEPEEITFSKKDKLYKEKFDSENAFNTAAIALLEGDISESEKKIFENYLRSHPEKQKDIELFGKTKLQADESITFDKKKKLYHYSIGRTIILWSGRIAAVLVLAFAIFALTDNTSKDQIPENQIAIIEEYTSVEKDEDEEVVVEEPIEVVVDAAESEIKKVVPIEKLGTKRMEKSLAKLAPEAITISRIPLTVPSTLQSLEASLHHKQSNYALVAMKRFNPEIEEQMYDERLLADVLKEKTGLNKFKFKTITKAGLNLVANISKDKFTYETNEDGEVTEYNYDSRLFAFSIPAKIESSDD